MDRKIMDSWIKWCYNERIMLYKTYTKLIIIAFCSSHLGLTFFLKFFFLWIGFRAVLPRDIFSFMCARVNEFIKHTRKTSFKLIFYAIEPAAYYLYVLCNKNMKKKKKRRKKCAPCFSCSSSSIRVFLFLILKIDSILCMKTCGWVVFVWYSILV